MTPTPEEQLAEMQRKYDEREKRLRAMPLNHLREIAREGGCFLAHSSSRSDLVRYILTKEYRTR